MNRLDGVIPVRITRFQGATNSQGDQQVILHLQAMSGDVMPIVLSRSEIKFLTEHLEKFQQALKQQAGAN